MDHDLPDTVLAVRLAMQERRAGLFDFIRSRPAPGRSRANPITKYVDKDWLAQAVSKVGLPATAEPLRDSGAGAEGVVFLHDTPGRAVNRSRQLEKALAPLARSVSDGLGLEVRALAELDVDNPDFDPDTGTTAYRVVLQPVATMGRNAAAGMKLAPSRRALINRALDTAGLDGNLPFKSPGAGVAQAATVLAHFGLEWDTVISLPPSPEGKRTFDLAFSDPEDSFSPTPVTNGVLYFSWYQHQNGKYEILAYVS